MLLVEMQPPLCYNQSMSIFASLGIIILSMIISLFLMLNPSIFANFLHYASGKYSRKKTDDLSLFFILGTETITVFIFFLTFMIISALPVPIITFKNPILLWIFTGIFFALGIVALCFYIQKNGQFFIPRKIATKIIAKPKFIKKRSDAFVFGLVSNLPELLFNLPLFCFCIITALNISLSPFSCAGFIILYALIMVLPLFAIHIFFKTGHTLADFLKFRLKNRSFLRFFLCSLYFLLAILLINLGIIA